MTDAELNVELFKAARTGHCSAWLAQAAGDRIKMLGNSLRDREAELYRCRTAENAAAHALDNELDDETRKRFAEALNRTIAAHKALETLVKLVQEDSMPPSIRGLCRHLRARAEKRSMEAPLSEPLVYPYIEDAVADALEAIMEARHD